MITRQYVRSLFIRFISSGGLATGLHWSVMWLLIAQNIDATVATFLGAVLGAIVNYFLQYYFTFQCQARHTLVFLKYLRVCLVGWVANAGLFYLLYHTVLVNAAWAQLWTTGLVTVLNFYLYHKVVFNEYSND